MYLAARFLFGSGLMRIQKEIHFLQREVDFLFKCIITETGSWRKYDDH